MAKEEGGLRTLMQSTWEEIVRLEPYIRKKAEQYVTTGVEVDDLVQEGMIILSKKLSQYDKDLSNGYIRYIDYYLHFGFLSYCNTIRYLVPIPKKYRLLGYKIERLQKTSEEHYGRKLSLEELEKTLQVPIHLIQEVQALNEQWMRKFHYSFEEVREIEIAKEEDESVYRQLENQLETTVLNRIEAQELLSRLTRFSVKEQETFLRRLGFIHGYPETYQEIAAYFGESFQNTQRRYKKIEKQLRDYYQKRKKS